MAPVVPNCGDGAISRQLLKAKSGEFDVQSIHKICLADADISDLGCIGECTSLQDLDLSCNNICHLYKLSAMISLTRLNLSANRIINLDGLESLENLEKLNLCGNLLDRADVIRTLVGLTKLTTLTLHDKLTGLTNPMCGPSYMEQVLLLLPTVVTLDGQRIRGKGSELYQLCRDIDKAGTNVPRVNHISQPKSNDMSKDITTPRSAPRKLQGGVLQAEEKVKDLAFSRWTSVSL